MKSRIIRRLTAAGQTLWNLDMYSLVLQGPDYGGTHIRKEMIDKAGGEQLNTFV
jgi:hypothetical protein